MSGPFFKLLFYFSLSFLVLSLSIKDETVFSHLSQTLSPYTQKVIKTLDSYLDQGLKRGKRLSKQLFSNSVPRKSSAMPVVEEESHFSEIPSLISNFNKTKFLRKESSSPQAPQEEIREDEFEKIQDEIRLPEGDDETAEE